MNLGTMEIVIIVCVVVLIFGPSRIPKLAKAAGDSIREWRNARKIAEEGAEQVRQEVTEIKRELR